MTISASLLQRAGRGLVVALVIAGSIAAWRWRTALDPTAATAFLAGHPTAPLVFLALHLAASLLFVPRTVFAVLAGLVFGIWWGIVWAALGSVLGAVAGFLLARHVHVGLVDPAGWTRFAPLLQRVERGGWRMVALVRLVPVIPHAVSNYALGLTRLGLAPYALGSLLGQLPPTIAYVELGGAGGRAIVGGADWLVPSAVGASALALSLLAPLVARRALRRADPMPQA